MDLRDRISDMMNRREMKREMKHQVNRAKDRFLDDDGFDFKSFISGLALGAGIAALGAILFAPQSGRETRTYLSDKGQEFGNKVKDTVERQVDMAKEKADHLLSQSRDQAGMKKKEAQKQFEATKEKAQDYTNQARERASETLDRTADKIEP